MRGTLTSFRVILANSEAAVAITVGLCVLSEILPNSARIARVSDSFIYSDSFKIKKRSFLEGDKMLAGFFFRVKMK